MDFESFKNPIKGSINVIFTKSSNSMYKQYLIYLKSGKLLSDEGLILSSQVDTVYYGVSDHREMLSDVVQKDFFASISIRNSELEEIYTRNYKKFQDVLAATGEWFIKR
jgi:hypothetical protein